MSVPAHLALLWRSDGCRWGWAQWGSPAGSGRFEEWAADGYCTDL